MRSIAIAFLVFQCLSNRVIPCSAERRPLESMFPDAEKKDAVIEIDTSGSTETPTPEEGDAQCLNPEASPMKSDPTLPPTPTDDLKPDIPETTIVPNPNQPDIPSDTAGHGASDKDDKVQVSPDGIDFSVARYCVGAIDCESALNEKCVPDDDNFVCGCEQGYERNERSMICQPSGEVEQNPSEVSEIPEAAVHVPSCPCMSHRRLIENDEIDQPGTPKISSAGSTKSEMISEELVKLQEHFHGDTEVKAGPGTPTESSTETPTPLETSPEASAEIPPVPESATEQPTDPLPQPADSSEEQPICRKPESSKVEPEEITTLTPEEPTLKTSEAPRETLTGPSAGQQASTKTSTETSTESEASTKVVTGESTPVVPEPTPEQSGAPVATPVKSEADPASPAKSEL